jgi:hypothetical protein
MNGSTQQIFDAALALPEADRIALAARLLESASDDVPGLSIDDDDLIAELDRRFKDREGAIDWDDLRSEG